MWRAGAPEPEVVSSLWRDQTTGAAEPGGDASLEPHVPDLGRCLIYGLRSHLRKSLYPTEGHLKGQKSRRVVRCGYSVEMSGYAGLMSDRRKNMSDSSDLVLSAFELDGTAVELADQDDLWWFVTQGTVIGG